MNSVVAVLLLLAALSSSAAPAVRFGGEVPLGPATTGEPLSLKQSPAIATDGTDYMALWIDVRGGVAMARVRPDGTLFDETKNTFFDIHPYEIELVWTGNRYLVFWSEYQTLYGAPLSREGVLGERRLLIDGFSGPFAVQTNGESVALVTDAGDFAIAQLVDTNLGLMARHFVQPHVNRDVLEVAVASDGTDYLIGLRTAYGGGSVHTVSLSAAGELGVPLLVPDSFDAQGVGLGSNGQSYFVAWSTNRLRGHLLSRDNRPAGGMHVFTGEAMGQGPGSYGPSIVARGSEYLVAYATGFGSLHTQRVAADGMPVGAPSFHFGRSFAVFGPRVALAAKSNGSGVMFWIDEETRAVAGVFGSGEPIGTSIFPEERVGIARGARQQLLPAATRAGIEPVVAWYERAFHVNEIRLMHAGQTAVAAEFVEAIWLDVAAHGNVIWLFWMEEEQGPLYVRRFNTSLAALDAEPLVLQPPAAEAEVLESVAAGAGSAIVVWSTVEGPYALRAQVLRDDGPVITPLQATALIQQGLWETDVTAVWNGEMYVVVWNHSQASQPMETPYDDARDVAVYAVRVSADSVPLDFAPIVVADPGATERVHRLKAVANGGAVVVAWQTQNGTFATRLAGSSAEPAVRIHPLTREVASLETLAATPDGRVDFYFLYYFQHTGLRRNARILHVRASETLAVDDEPKVVATYTTTRDEGVRIDATNQANLPVLLYVRHASEEPHGGVERIFVKRGEPTGRRRAVR